MLLVFYTTGISSGGRMDVAYPSRFRALSTLSRNDDVNPIMPLAAMALYTDRLDELGVETRTIVAPVVGHAWIDAAPQSLVDCFVSHP
ncbi:MAG: hypothetical protein GWP91_15915 [Rhodobacterales bacterium]|nr:hypothetical protein [Rhodobacterales bacterium]